MTMFIAALAAYLIGSIPFGLLLGKLAGIGDLRATGSGNIGATNMLRAGGKKLAALTLLLDMGKGAVAVLLVRHFAPEAVTVAMIAVILGHCFPVWLKFKGGKGVATTLGVYLPFIYPFLVLAATWLAVFALTRTSSLAAMVMVLLMPVYAYFGHGWEQAAIAACISAIVLYRHKENIRRLLKGEEKKL